MAEIKFNYRNALPSNPNSKELYFIKNNNKGLLYRGSELIAETSAEEIESLANNVATALESIQTLYETKQDAADKLIQALEGIDELGKGVEAVVQAMYGEEDYSKMQENETPLTIRDIATEEANKIQSNLNDHKLDITLHFTEAEKAKLSGIEDGAQKNTITGVKGDSEITYRTGNVNITKSNIGLGNVDNTSDTSKPVSTAQQAAINEAAATAKNYTDEQVALLLNNSSEAIDSIFELAEAMRENDDVVEALSNAVGVKADKAELNNYYTKTEIENDAVLITTADIDEICSVTLVMASEVTF